MGNIYVESIQVMMHAATNAPVPVNQNIAPPAYTAQQGGPYGAPQGGPYGAPQGGPYGAPQGGPYGASPGPIAPGMDGGDSVVSVSVSQVSKKGFQTCLVLQVTTHRHRLYRHRLSHRQLVPQYHPSRMYTERVRELA